MSVADGARATAAAALEGRAPELVGVGFLPLSRQGLPPGAKPRLPAGVGELGQSPARLLGGQQQGVTGRTGVEHRLHHRLHQAPDTGPRGQVVPALKCVVLGQQQVALGGGLIEE
jgi:hypothetical protein